MENPFVTLIRVFHEPVQVVSMGVENHLHGIKTLI
jgi:hypothetical protein